MHTCLRCSTDVVALSAEHVEDELKSVQRQLERRAPGATRFDVLVPPHSPMHRQLQEKQRRRELQLAYGL